METLAFAGDSPEHADHGDTSEMQREIRLLGRVLLASADEVIEAITDRARRRRSLVDEPELDPVVEERFLRLGTLATIAVARWMSGEPVDDASAAGEEFSRSFAQMVASSDVELREVVRRCRYWRDGCDLALREAAESGLVSDVVLGFARETIHRAADHALAQMSAIFDSEHRRMQRELARRQRELSFLATHDGLTKLANRSLLMDRLERMLARSQRTGAAVAALFIDLDDFKLINDTLGHGSGDRLLQAVAERLRGFGRGADTLGRLGGDEFVLLAADVGDPRAVAARLLSALSKPFHLDDHSRTLRVTASVGIAVASRPTSAEQLLCEADVAMYHAKADGGGTFALHEPGMQLALEDELSEAMATDDLPAPVTASLPASGG